MDIIQAAGLGLLQGVTEFLPVSSSGHLILAEDFWGLRVEELQGFDIILHGGTLVALLFVFWQKIVGMLRGDFGLLGKLVVATVPGAVFGLLAKDWIEANCRTVLEVGIEFVIMGVFYFVLTRFAKPRFIKTNYAQAWWMGVAQAVAIMPGISRSGATVGMGELLGLRREEAAEFGFLMVIPVILGALALVLVKGEMSVGLPSTDLLLVGFTASAVSSFLVAKGMLRFFRHFGLKVFGYYLLLLGSVLILSRYI